MCSKLINIMIYSKHNLRESFQTLIVSKIHIRLTQIVHILYLNIHMSKSKKYGRSDCLNYESVHMQRLYVIIFI